MRRSETSKTLKNNIRRNYTVLQNTRLINKRLTLTHSKLKDNSFLHKKYRSNTSIKTHHIINNNHHVSFPENLIITTTNNSIHNNNIHPPSSPKRLLSQQSLFHKVLSNRHVFKPKTSSLTVNDTNYCSTISKEPTLQDFIQTPRSNSSNHTETVITRRKSSKRLIQHFSKNQINFKERSEIKRAAEKFVSNTTSYGTLFEINPETLINNNQSSLSKRNSKDINNNTISTWNRATSSKKLTTLMKKTLYDIIPSKLKYNYETSSKFRDLLSNTEQALHYQKKDSRKFLKSTTVLIKKSKQHNKVLEQLLKQRNKDPSQNKQMKHFLKLQSIKWLWQHKNLLIEKLFLYYHNYKWFFDKNEYLDKKKFKEFLIITNLGKDDEFAEHLFITFEKQNIKEHTEIIYFKECLYNLILTADYSFDRKVQLMLSIIENIKRIPIKKYMRLLWMVLINAKEWNYINILLKNNGIDTGDEGFVDKQIVYKVLIGSKIVKGIFEGYYARYMQLNEGLSEQLANKFNFTVPNTLNLVYKKNEVRVINNMEVNKLEKILDIKKQKKELVDKMNGMLAKEMEGKENEDSDSDEINNNDNKNKDLIK